MTDRRREKLLPIPRWPTAEEATASRWFSPIRLGPRQARDRTWVPAMVPWRATDDGFVTDAVCDWYARFAAGRPGVLVVEATGIRDVPSGPLLRAGHDRFIPGLKRLVNTVADASGGQTLLLIQLIDFLPIKRRPNRDAFLSRFLALTPRLRAALGEGTDVALRSRLAALPEDRLTALLDARELEAYQQGLRERVTDVHLPHIAELPRTLPPLFAQAARRCEEAGFGGVELHFAHAYTMASFLSALNDRSDGYGGPRENRVRLPVEVYRAVREQLGPRTVLGCRFLADEIIAHGNRADDAAFFGVELARAGMDFLSLSRGGKFEDAKQPKVGHAAYPYTGPSGQECMPTTNIGAPGPFGRNLEAIAEVKRALVAAGLKTPVVACGGIASFWQAEQVLALEGADIVAAARQSLADPDWFEKIRQGKGDQVRRCLFTNYCEGLDQSHQAVTCQLWDRAKGLTDDGTVPRTKDGRRLVAPQWR